MQTRGLLVSTGVAGIVLTACSSGTPLLPQRQPQPVPIASTAQHRFRPILASTVLATSTIHYLYVSQDATVAVYRLPLTATSTPALTIDGFSDVSGITATPKNIYLADNAYDGNSMVDILYRGGSNAYMSRCSFSYPGALGIAANATDLYVTSNLTAYWYVSQYANGTYGTGACSSEMPVTDGNGVSNPWGLAVDSAYVYVANGAQVFAYAIPLTADEPPSATTVATLGQKHYIAVTNTDLYVTEGGGGTSAPGTILDYALPLSSSSTVAAVELPTCSGPFGESPNGITAFPAITSAKTKPKQLFVSDVCSGNIYMYTLPLKSTSTPSIVIVGANAWGGLYAR